MKKAKILQIIPFFVPAWSYGGPVKVCFDISRELVIKNYDVTVLTTDVYDEKSRMQKLKDLLDGVLVLRFRNISNRLAKNYNLYLPIGFKKYLDHNIKNYDLVHLHAFFTYQNILARKLCLKNKIPYIIHLHEKFDPLADMGRTLPKKIFLKLYGHNLIKDAKNIIVLSEGEKNNLLKYDPSLSSKIVVIPNPAPSYQGKCLNSKKIRQKYHLTADNKVILSLSRLSFIKGIDYLILAFAKLVKKDPKFRLVIAGPDEGGQKSNLDRLINDLGIREYVQFTGIVQGREKEELFCMADIYALFSVYESFGMTVLEALANGVPVALSKHVGLAPNISRFGCGQIVNKIKDSKESAFILENVYNNKDDLSKNCPKALKDFSPDRIINQLIQLYNRLI